MLSIVMLSIIMLSIVILSVSMLSVVMVNSVMVIAVTKKKILEFHQVVAEAGGVDDGEVGEGWVSQKRALNPIL